MSAAAALTERVQYDKMFNSRSCVWEIEEEESAHVQVDDDNNIEHSDKSTLSSRPPNGLYHHNNQEIFSTSIDIDDHQDCVYVAVGISKSAETSMGALLWTLNNAVNPNSTLVHLIHIFPEIKSIPTPLGMLPKNQASPKQVESHMAQERGKKREQLQKFLSACSASKVKVDTSIIESDFVAKAILDLIPILHISKLVVGTTKSNLRRLRSRKGNGISNQLLQNATIACELKIICEGKEVNIDEEMINGSPSPRLNARDTPKPKSPKHENQQNNAFLCMCFRPKFV